jgi:hypothetical protein
MKRDTTSCSSASNLEAPEIGTKQPRMTVSPFRSNLRKLWLTQTGNPEARTNLWTNDTEPEFSSSVIFS